MNSSFILIPVISGIIGYMTNKLAIKMLFRPYKPHWYTFGWQGIIPRSRNQLAEKISITVSEKLISYNDVSSALSKSNADILLNNAISHKIDSVSINDIENIIKLIDINNIINNNKVVISNFIDSKIKLVINALINKKIDSKNIYNIIANIIKEHNISCIIYDKLIETVLMYAYSSSNIKDIIPSNVYSKKEILLKYITEEILYNIKELGKDKFIKEAISTNIIIAKNNKFKIVSMFISDESIYKAIDDKLPDIALEISKNPNMYSKIYNILNNKLEQFITSPMYTITENIGADNIKTFLKDIKKALLKKEIIETYIYDFINSVINNQEITIKVLLEKININIHDYIEIDINHIINDDNINNIENKISYLLYHTLKKQNDNLSIFISNFIINSIINNMPKILNTLNVENMIKSKIDNMPTKDVENLLLSFMKNHFKWINIMGFIIGFIIGVIQVIMLIFLKNPN